MQASIAGENAINMPVGSYHIRCLVINPPCNPLSASTLSRSSNAKNQRSPPPPLIQVDDSIGGAECYGFELVDQQFGDHQWETNSLRSSRDDDRIQSSNTGWGACWKNQKMGGHWSFQESQLHINTKYCLLLF